MNKSMSQPGTVAADLRDHVMILTLDNPPINALSWSVRSALFEAITAVEGDADIHAVIIRSAGTHFVAGADIREFEQEPRPPLLNDVLQCVEACSKPVVAAMHGSVLGGGLELALACHYRLAPANASFGMPEIRLGLLPGSGGTQRLPRLIGAAESVKFMLSGDPIGGDRAYALGIIDRLVANAELDHALAYARELVAQGGPPRRLRDQPVEGGELQSTFVDEQRTIARRKYPGVDSRDFIIECVEASLTLPFEAGVALGRRRFEECRRSDASRALRRLFFAERSGDTKHQARSVMSVGVLGAGTMGSGIAISLAIAGLGVVIVDTSAPALTAGMERLRSTLEAQVKKGRLSRAVGNAALARVRSSDKIESLADMDFVIEAIFENLSVKQEVFRVLGKICSPRAVLASNTSTLDVDAIADASGRPTNVIGMHFFSPANVMRLVEIVRGASTSPEVVSTVIALTKRIGKLGIVVGNCFGFVGNRMLYAYGRENQLLMLEGATPTQVDAVMEQFGMAMGPNAVGDLAGLDVGYRVRRERKDRPDDPRYYRVVDLLVEAGRLGQKSHGGAFSYAAGSRRPIREIAVEKMIEAEAKALGVRRRTIADEEVRQRCLFALINEGAKILEEGIAAAPGDIDAIWCNGYGFPRFRGGPLCYADSIGASTVLSAIRGFAQTHGERYWIPSTLLVEIAARGETFDAWGRRASRVS
jgi:3-hydroxyacyl-CoA dehydrogenase